MERWISTNEILQENRLSETNLIFAVISGVLTAYDAHDFSPIDWEGLKKQFNELSAYCEQEREKDSSWGLVIVSSGDWSKKATLYANRERIPIKALLNIRSTKRNIEISYEQYFEIKSGWSNKQVREYLDDAVFKESNIESLNNKDNNHLNEEVNYQQPARIDPRVERTDLIIIGGLLSLLHDQTTLTSNADVIQALQEWQPNYPGLKKRTLEGRFSAAKKALEIFE